VVRKLQPDLVTRCSLQRGLYMETSSLHFCKHGGGSCAMNLPRTHVAFFGHINRHFQRLFLRSFQIWKFCFYMCSPLFLHCPQFFRNTWTSQNIRMREMAVLCERTFSWGGTVEVVTKFINVVWSGVCFWQLLQVCLFTNPICNY